MSPFLLLSVIVVLVMAHRLADLYAGGHYVCPSCGARSERRHSAGCPWGRSPTG
jgi:hypothetical protein